MFKIIRVYLFLFAMTFAGVTFADWPTSATTPLVLGEVLGFGTDHRVVSTPDGATWIAWIDGPCFPSLFVQRINAQGITFGGGPLALDPQNSCPSLNVRLEALPDNTVVVNAIGNDLSLNPVHRIAANGLELWTPSVVADDVGGEIHDLLALPGGNALIASQTGSPQNGVSISVGNYAAAGTPVWAPPATFLTGGGSNMRIFAIESDGSGGAYVLWDGPGAYVRTIKAMRIAADGTQAWDNPVLMVGIPPGSSRHTDPVAIADGVGGLILVWTQGAEQGITPVPIRMQRLFPDGTTLFDMAGARISTSTTRQFDVQVRKLSPGGDLYFVWRDGQFDDMQVRTQRMTLDGQRVWGDTGTLVAPLANSASSFSFDWLDADTIGIAITDATNNSNSTSVNVHRIDALGQVAPLPWPISGTAAASSVTAISIDGGLAVVWQRETTTSMSEFVAQRVNVDGSLGSTDSDGDGVSDLLDNCSAIANVGQIDTDGDGIGNRCDPDFDDNCVVNFLDYAQLTAAFMSTTSPEQDLNSDGVVNFLDIGIFPQFFMLQPGPSGLPSACN